jgi:Bacterial SH3 domain
VTAVAVGTAIAWQDPRPDQTAQKTPASVPPLDRYKRSSRDLNSTRPQLKATPTRKPAPRQATKTARASAPKPTKTTPKPTGSRWVTANLNVRSDPDKLSPVISLLSAGSKVPLTGRVQGDWVEVLLDGKPGWVKASYLSTTEPEDAPSVISQAPCESGSEVENGLTDDAIRVHRALCARFDGITSYGGLRGGGGEHSVGRALDVMIGSDQSLGDEIAAWVRANHEALGVSEVIWAQRIWTVERSSDGWRPMEDRGSATANHYDHVHVTVYGSSGG